MDDNLTPEEEGARLRSLFGDRNKAQFAKDHKVPGGASMISQHMSGHRPIGLGAAAAYSRGLGVRVEAFSPRLAKAIEAAAGDHAATTRPPAPAPQLVRPESSTTFAAPSLPQALEVVAAALNKLPEETRELAALRLQTLARAPDSARAMESVLTALQLTAEPPPPTVPGIAGQVVTRRLSTETADFVPIEQPGRKPT